jgi:hypothetical protein
MAARTFSELFEIAWLLVRFDHATSFIVSANDRIVCRYPDREPSGNNLKKRCWSLGYVSTVDSQGRTTWIADAHRDDGKRFVVHADEKLTAFLELESAVRACGELCLTTTSLFHLLRGARVCLSKVP